MTTEQHANQIRADERHRLPRQPAGQKKLRKGRDRLQRFLGMIRLLAAGQEWPAKRLSEAFEVTERTVHRDMKLLEQAGLVTRLGGQRGGSYRMASEAAWERPQLSLTEVVTLLSLTERGPDGGTDSERAVASAAVAKLILLQPDDARQRLEELTALLQIQSASARTWLCSQPWLPLVMEAIAGHWPLRVWLQEELGEVCDVARILIPQRIEAAGEQWLLAAYEIGGTEIPAVDLGRVIRLEFDVGRD